MPVRKIRLFQPVVGAFLIALSAPVHTLKAATIVELEYGLIAPFSISVNETLELHTVSGSEPSFVAVGEYVAWIYFITDINDQTCTQTEILAVARSSLVTTIAVQINQKVLRLNNGEAEAMLDDCFTGQRYSLAVAVPVTDPCSATPELQPTISSYSIVNTRSGETIAAGTDVIFLRYFVDAAPESLCL
jgi:hypothetical protein